MILKLKATIQVITFIIVLLLFGSCKKSNSNYSKDLKYDMRITHYYSIKTVNNKVIRDTLKNCFSCNQALVTDKTGKELEKRFYKSNMKDLFSYEIYNYDDKGNKIGSFYYEKDTLITQYKYQLDNLGRIKIGKAYDIKSDTLNYGYLNEYDKNGNHFSTGTMNSKGKIYNYYVRKFNSNGIAIIEDIQDLKGNSTFNVKYEYRPKADSLWTEQLTYYNNTLKEIRFREYVKIDSLLK